MWLEHMARGDMSDSLEFPCPPIGNEIDWHDTLIGVIERRAVWHRTSCCWKIFEMCFVRSRSNCGRITKSRPMTEGSASVRRHSSPPFCAVASLHGRRAHETQLPQRLKSRRRRIESRRDIR